MPSASGEDSYRESFSKYDTNGDGQLDQEELARWDAGQAGLFQRFRLAGSYRNPPSCADLKKSLATSDSVCYSYNEAYTASFGPLLVVLSGRVFLIFSWSLWLQGAILVALAFLFGHTLCDGAFEQSKEYCLPMAYQGGTTPTPEGVNLAMACVAQAQASCWGWYDYGESTAKTLVGFVIAGFISLLLANVYYANRSMSGTVYSQTIGISSMVATYIRPVHPEDSDECEQVKHIQQLLLRWVNAAYRIMFHVHRNEGAALVLMDGLLLEDEWEELKDMPKPAMNLYQWMADVICTCHQRGFIHSDVILGQFQTMLEALRSSDSWGIPSLPYVYTLFVALLVKMYLFFFTFLAGGFIWRSRLLRDIPGYTDMAMSTAEINSVNLWQAFLIMCVNFFYQGALDLHAMLKYACKGDLAGRLDVLGLCHYSAKVSTSLINNAKRRDPQASQAIQLDVPKQNDNALHVNVSDTSRPIA